MPFAFQFIHNDKGALRNRHITNDIDLRLFRSERKRRRRLVIVTVRLDIRRATVHTRRGARWRDHGVLGDEQANVVVLLIPPACCDLLNNVPDCKVDPMSSTTRSAVFVRILSRLNDETLYTYATARTGATPNPDHLSPYSVFSISTRHIASIDAAGRLISQGLV
jgi:hypothetical protein